MINLIILALRNPTPIVVVVVVLASLLTAGLNLVQVYLLTTFADDGDKKDDSNVFRSHLGDGDRVGAPPQANLKLEPRIADPDLIRNGLTVKVTGTGFTPNAGVDLFFDADAVVEGSTDDNGNFITEFGVPSDAARKEGSHHVELDDVNAVSLAVTTFEVLASP